MILLFQRLVLCLTLLTPLTLTAFDNAHFYRATNFPGEPRFEKSALSSLDISIAGGSTKCGRNSCGTKTSILDIYGLYNMQDLGVGVPGKDLSNPADIALTMLALVPEREGFATFKFFGRFNVAEAYVKYQQNITDGFFISLNIPIRNMSIANIQYVDLSPQDNLYPNINTPQWQMFLNLFPQILAKYNLSIGSACEKGVGDFTALLGWTQNYNATEDLDYIDWTLQSGYFFLPEKNKT